MIVKLIRTTPTDCCLKLLIAALVLVSPRIAASQQRPPVDGEFEVGFQTLDLEDTDRSRSLQTLVWYPVDQADAAGEPLRYPQHNSNGFWWYESPFIGGYTDAPASDSGPFPVIALSHGNGGWPVSFAMLGESLASHGFVVAAPRHTGNAWGTPDDSSITIAERSRDIDFTLSHLLGRNEVPGDLFEGKLDPNSIGLGGYSRGTSTVAESAPDTPGLKAVLYIEGIATADFDVPVLKIAGANSRYQATDFSVPVSYGFDIGNTHHWSFGTNACQFRDQLIEAGGDDSVLGADSGWPGCADGLRPPGEVQMLIAEQAAAFFTAHLREEPTFLETLLPDPQNVEDNGFVFEIVAESQDSFEFLLTDPSGRRVGIDPDTGEMISDLEGVRYSGSRSFRRVSIPSSSFVPDDYSVDIFPSDSATTPVSYSAFLSYSSSNEHGTTTSVESIISQGLFSLGDVPDTLVFSVQNVPEPTGLGIISLTVALNVIRRTRPRREIIRRTQ